MVMERRSLAFALAGATLLPAAAMAQGTTPRAASPSAAPRANTPPSNLANTPPDRLAMMTHEAGAFSLMTAKVGMEKASNTDVKRFAQFEVTEQEGVARAMRLAGHNFPQPNLQGDKAQAMQRLQSASGADFDRMFLQVQEQGHQELLNLTTAIMGSRAPAPDMIMAILANGQIKEHLILIGLMQGRS
jgi:putative membrane protein